MNKNSFCKQCLIKENTTLLDDFFPVKEEKDTRNLRISKIILNEDNICQYCFEYNKNFDKEYIQDEIVYFIKGKDYSSKALVALSGGKDSLSALFLASKILDMKVIAFTYDNGFIPNFVIEQSKRICDELDIEYIIQKKELYKEFKEEYFIEGNKIKARTGLDFCQICSKKINEVQNNLSEKYGITKVIYGNKIYTKLSPKVSCLKKTTFNDSNGNLQNILNINLLFALGTDLSIQEKILKELKWEDPKLTGYTSNCLIPGFVSLPRYESLGFHNDSGYIEMELRSGLYNKKQVEDILNNDLPEDKTKEIIKFLDSILIL
jgi:hypothetical protein